jgi:thioredoxin-related protein
MARSDTYPTQEIPRYLLVLFGLSTCFCLLSFFLPPLPFAKFSEAEDLVPWHPLSDGVKLAVIKNKPALFFFTTDNLDTSKKLVRECFSDEDLAAAINDMTIPTRVVDKMKEHGRNPENIALAEKQFMQGTILPQLVVVPPDQLEGTITAKTFAYVSGDCNKQAIYKLLEIASLEHDTYFDRGYVSWTSPQSPQAPGRMALYVFMKLGNSRCTELSNEVFKDQEVTDYLNQNLSNYLLINGGTEHTLAPVLKLEDKFKIDFYPTIVLFDPVSERAAFQIGYSGAKPTLEFIQRSHDELTRKTKR